MYELNRVRLVGIGPRGARYTDVTLDLSGVGARVERQNLLDEPGRRPSAYTLLMLENGGGKSVLLSLLFSVVLPGRKKTVGGASLEKFVLDTDTGHVALEWMHVRTGDRLVTAKVYQRRTPTAGNTSPLHEAWYSFHPSETLDLATLPIADGERRRRFDGYKDAVEQADRALAATQLAWLGDDQGRWRNHLRANGIEPDLFDIQRSMNADEGDAADAFKFSSSKAFVDWLLRTVTDPADAASVAETFEQWAITLADRTKMLLERDFLEGAVAGLDPLAEAWRTHSAAERAATRAVDTASDLSGALAFRHAEEQARSEILAGEVGTARERTAVAEKTTRDTRDTRNEIHLQTLRLECTEVEAARRVADADLTAVELELAGWDTVALIQQVTEADEQARSLARQVTEADRGAAADLRRRDQAAGRVLAKLDAEAAACDARHATHLSLADAEREAATAANQEWSEALQFAAAGEQRQETVQSTIDHAEQALAVAAAEGLVTAGTGFDDVPDLLQAATIDHGQQEVALAAARTRADDLRGKVVAEDTELTAAVKELTALVRAADCAQDAVDVVSLAAARIAALPAVAARAGEREEDDAISDHHRSAPDSAGSGDAPGQAALTPDELDAAAETLLDILAADIEAHTDQYDALREEQREDTRVLQAVGDGGLLPPRAEVERAVEVLAAAGVAAHPGWRYLRDTAAVHLRAELISAHPELADGVVLVDPAQLPAAQRALNDARLLPPAAVVVGSGAELLSPPVTPQNEGDRAPATPPSPDDVRPRPAERFVIVPSPAMYDEDAAEQIRTGLLATLTARNDRIEDVRGQLDDVRNAHSKLSGWRQDNPPGRLAGLREDARTKTADVERQRSAIQEQQDRRDELLQQRKAAEENVATLTRTEREAADRLQQLDRLAERVQAGADATALLPGILDEIRLAAQNAHQADGRRARHQQAVDLNIRLAAQAHAQAERHRAACGEVISTDGTRADHVPEEPLPTLHAQARAAHATYLAAAAHPDLRAQAEESAAKAAGLRQTLTLRDPAHVAEGRRLLATPAGADRTGWATAIGNARQRRQQLQGDRDQLTGEIGRLEQAISQQQPESGSRWILLPPEKVPTSVTHGQALTREAADNLRAAQAALETARASMERLQARQREVANAMQDFEKAILPIKAVLGATAPAAPPGYAGSATDALIAAENAVTAMNETRDRVARTKRALDSATDELTKYTHQDRYDNMPNPVRRSILGADRAMLGARAEEWAALLRARHASLMMDLESADRHRKSIVERLSALVTQALGTLRQATRLSRLPDDLGDWAGRTFLRISFSEPDIGAIRVRVATIVDDLAAAFAARTVSARGGRARRDGMGLLLDAVHAAVPKGFAVDVLKPDSVLRDERAAIEDVKEIFSGGQELTTAIVLYCTLAALRASQRGQMRAKHSGVLFLDNPIGKASATYLLDVQQAVARSLGVQLIYTTGLFDDRVLASFPLWIRLRNDADLRAGLKHIRVSEIVARVLPDPYTPGELETSGATGTTAPGTVTATRIHRRPGLSQDGSQRVVPA